PHSCPPLPLLDDFRVGLLDQSVEAGKHLSALVAWLLDSRVYQSKPQTQGRPCPCVKVAALNSAWTRTLCRRWRRTHSVCRRWGRASLLAELSLWVPSSSGLGEAGRF